jgi:putative zinc finger/helix-turn-helix YgiT family protein
VTNSKSERCVVCDRGRARERRRIERASLLGKTVAFRRREYVCDRCGEAYTNDAQGTANDAAERTALGRALGQVGSAELRALRAMTGVTQAELGRALGLGKNVLPRWETGQRKPPKYIQTIVRLLAINPAALAILSALAQAHPPGGHVRAS